jgi:predicted dehydrogenase
MPIRLGVFGVGHFGRFHALKLAARGVLSGVHDADPQRAAAIAAECGAPALDAAGLVCEEAAVTMRAENTIELAGDDAERMQKLLDVLEDLDDVQDVFHNAAL